MNGQISSGLTSVKTHQREIWPIFFLSIKLMSRVSTGLGIIKILFAYDWQ